MSNENSIINLDELSKPANTLVEKISDAIGGVFKPYQIRRIARAEAEAEKIKVLSRIETTKLEQRALKRFMYEEAKKQFNIESIITKALPRVAETADPQNIEDDWIVNFFDKSKLISDEMMQDLWARILAGEANTTGSFSKRTIYLLSSLDKKDAVCFEKLCNFIWNIGGPTSLVFDTKGKIYEQNGIDFSILHNLNSIGLISLEPFSGYIKRGIPKNLTVTYQGSSVNIEFLQEEKNELHVGHILLTDAGIELSRVCNTKSIDGFIEYSIGKWREQGLKVSQN